MLIHFNIIEIVMDAIKLTRLISKCNRSHLECALGIPFKFSIFSKIFLAPRIRRGPPINWIIYVITVLILLSLYRFIEYHFNSFVYTNIVFFPLCAASDMM
jgi:hypothetical protein